MFTFLVLFYFSAIHSSTFLHLFRIFLILYFFRNSIAYPIHYEIDLGGVLITFYKVIRALVSIKTWAIKSCTSMLIYYLLQQCQIFQTNRQCLLQQNLNVLAWTNRYQKLKHPELQLDCLPNYLLPNCHQTPHHSKLISGPCFSFFECLHTQIGYTRNLHIPCTELSSYC